MRKTIAEQPCNVARLSRCVVSRLWKAAASQALTSTEKVEAINAVSILTSMLPVLFEAEHEHKLVLSVFWQGTMPGVQEPEPMPLAQPLMDSVVFLLSKPGFSCDAPGLPSGVPLAESVVGRQHDAVRTGLLKLSEWCEIDRIQEGISWFLD